MMKPSNNRLAELREDRGVSRRDLAVALDVTEESIRRMERPGELIPAKYIGTLVRHLDCTADHLLGLDRQPSTGAAA
jgi:DNA-binding Xre family transcriptional regulator